MHAVLRDDALRLGDVVAAGIEVAEEFRKIGRGDLDADPVPFSMMTSATRFMVVR